MLASLRKSTNSQVESPGRFLSCWKYRIGQGTARTAFFVGDTRPSVQLNHLAPPQDSSKVLVPRGAPRLCTQKVAQKLNKLNNSRDYPLRAAWLSETMPLLGSPWTWTGTFRRTFQENRGSFSGRPSSSQDVVNTPGPDARQQLSSACRPVHCMGERLQEWRL